MVFIQEMNVEKSGDYCQSMHHQCIILEISTIKLKRKIIKNLR